MEPIPLWVILGTWALIASGLLLKAYQLAKEGKF